MAKESKTTPSEPKSAEDLFTEFREHSVAEFFTKNRQMLGYSGKVKSLTTVVHEYVTNSLDACEEAGILPTIYVKIKEMKDGALRVTCEDNGPGVPKKHIGQVFASMLAGTKFHRYLQQRGQQGIGATGCTMFSQITTGKPTSIVSSTGGGEAYKVQLMIDIKENKAVFMSDEVVPMNFRGLKVEADFKSVTFVRSEQSPFEYLKRTALANPHMKLVFKGPDKQTVTYDRAVKMLPKPPEPVQPHPYGIGTHDLINFAHASSARTLGSFLVKDLSRVSPARLKEIMKKCPDVDFNMLPRELGWHEAEKIVKSFKEIKFLAPPTSGLRPIGADQIKIALENILNPDFVEVIERPPALYRGGVPFIIEVAIAYGGQAGRNSAEGKKMEIMRFANRAPLLFDSGGCVINKAVNSIDWKRYELKDAENSPVTAFVNVVSVHIPYQSAGKQAIATEEDVLNEIRLALMDCARRLKSFLHGRRKRYERQKKFDLFMKYIPEVAGSLSELTGKKKEKLSAVLSDLVQNRLGIDELGEEESEASSGTDEEEAPKEEGEEETEEIPEPAKKEKTKKTPKEKKKVKKNE